MEVPPAPGLEQSSENRASCFKVLTLRSLFEGGFEELGPVGEMVEGGGVCVVEMQRGDGDGGVTDGGVIGVFFDVLIHLLLVEPEVAAAARVGAFLQKVARNFFGLPDELHNAAPIEGHIDVEQDL